MAEIKTQVAVVGGGPAGYPAAFHAADLGMDVTLIDLEENPGGVCLYRGCIPSKALLHVAAILNETRESEAYGVSFSDVKLDVARLRAWKESVVGRLTGGLGQLTRQRKIRFMRGYATLVDGHTLEVAVEGKQERERLVFEHAILATGSVPATVPVFPDSPRIIDSTGALALADVPERLLVVGGGYIGLELGQAYAAFGSRVTVVEMLPTLLAGADADLARILVQRLKKQFDAIMTDTKVVEMEDSGESVVVKVQDKAGTVSQHAFDRVLVSVGRRPNTRNLGLENTNVRVLDAGFVDVDRQRRTAEPSLFAIGDIAGQPMLAHKATHEAKVAVEAIAGRKTVYDPRAVPAVVFTDPEIAWCGVTEAEAATRNLDVKITRFPWAASGRATTLGRNDGMTKIVAEADGGRVLGIGLAGPGAGELVGEATLAVEMGAVAEDLALTIHPHPTLSETIMEAAEAFGGHSTHFMGRT